MILDRLLLPTDFSACADQALSHAIAVAERFDAELHILHVVNELDPDWYGISDADDRAVKLRDQIQAEARDRLHELAPDTALDTTVALQHSFDVADSVTGYVDEHAIDLVVMGTHGRRGFDRLMLGNVADKVIRHTACPVMTVREEASLAGEQDVAFRDVLAPIDFSDPARQALEVSKAFAGAYHARLHLLFVAEKRTVPTFSDTGIPGVGVVEMDPKIVENAEQALAQLDADVDGPEVETHYHVRKGTVSETIVDVAEDAEVGLIVMATRGLTGASRFLLGSNTERVVRGAPCPVLTIPTAAQETTDDGGQMSDSHERT